ncbi:MAG: glycosyltransferase family 39 protein [Planctomycetes bacterium]|nr:glycosyltransferase family 39 protein [Planctomycetota bacterium]
MDALALAAGLLTFLLCGDLLLRLLGASESRHAAGRVGLALLLGPGAIAFALFVLSLCGAPLCPAAMRGLAALVWAGWAARACASRRKMRPDVPASGGRRLDLAFAALLVLFLLPVLIGAAFALVVPPFKDSLVTWSLKALIIFQDGSVRSPDLVAENRFLFHPNYPLLVPLAQVFLFGLRGEALEHAAKIVLPLAHLGIGLALFSFLRARMSARRALALAALLSATPHFYRTDDLYTFAGSTPSGYADPMLAALCGAACLATLEWLAGRRLADLLLAAVFLGLAVFTKNEGAALAVCVAVAAAGALFLDRLRGRALPRARDVALGLFAFALVALPWAAHRATLPARDENYPERARLEVFDQHVWRVPTLAAAAVEESVSWRRHGLLWPLLLCALVLRRRRLLRRESVFLLGVIAGMAAIYFAMFVVTPLRTVELVRTAAPRVFFHLAAAVVLLAGCLLSGDEKNAAGGTPPVSPADASA